jgi:hypothetical protein
LFDYGRHFARNGTAYGPNRRTPISDHSGDTFESQILQTVGVRFCFRLWRFGVKKIEC